MKEIHVTGFIKLVENYDPGDGLYIGGEVLSDKLDIIDGANVSVTFYISDIEKSLEELNENLIKTITGVLSADYGDRYSEYTGYLWTTDCIEIDNHDLRDDLSLHDGKFCYLILKINNES